MRMLTEQTLEDIVLKTKPQKARKMNILTFTLIPLSCYKTPGMEDSETNTTTKRRTRINASLTSFNTKYWRSDASLYLSPSLHLLLASKNSKQ